MNFMSGNERSSKAVAVHGIDKAPLDSAGWQISYRLLEPAAMALDTVAILVAGFVSERLYLFLSNGSLSDRYYFSSAAVVAILFVGIAKMCQLYRPAKLLALGTQIRSTVLIWGGILFLCVAAIFALKIGAHFSSRICIVFGVFGLSALSCHIHN